MVDRIYRIVTGPEINQELHAHDFLSNNVVGIGFFRVGDISNMTESQLENKCAIYGVSSPHVKETLSRFRDKIKIGDIVIAYKFRNTIVAVGRIVGKYFFDNNYNRDSEEELGKLGLPHRRKVIWRKKPRFFNRKLLPDEFSSQLIKRGTLIQIYYDFSIIEKELEKIS